MDRQAGSHDGRSIVVLSEPAKLAPLTSMRQAVSPGGSTLITLCPLLVMQEWYSGKLIEHADEILSRAANILRENVGDNTTVNLGAKVAGVHWWYRSHSHAAELTAGYYNTSYRDGYAPIAAVFARHGVALNFP